MFIAKVRGNVVTTQKVPKMTGKKLLIIEPLKVEESGAMAPTGKCIVAVDSIGAGTEDIVLVTQGERALLGRQPSWPPRLYSTIAGFVEPGESLEDAVVREVFEERGVEVASVQYQSSQPWPFPSSLMLGFRAEARSTEIRLHDAELDDAQWFTREDILSGHPKLPPAPSISHHLIESWFDAGGGPTLASLRQDFDWKSVRD